MGRGAAPGFELPADAPRVRKGTNGEDGYSGFTMRDPVTAQEIADRARGPAAPARASSASWCAGLATDYCVQATAIDAVRLGFAVELLADGVAAVNLQPGDGDRAMSEMAEAGVVIG